MEATKANLRMAVFNLIAINRHQEDRLLPSPTIDHQLDRWMENDDTGARARLARLAVLALWFM